MQYELASEGVMWVMGRCYEIVGSNTDPEQTLALLLRSEMNLCIDSALHECLKQPLGDTPLIRTHADTKTWACNVMKEMLHK